MKSHSSMYVRLVVIGVFVLAGLVIYAKTSSPAQASSMAQVNTGERTEIQEELIATVGEPFISDQLADKGKTLLQLTDKAIPGLDSPVAPADPLKEPKPENPNTRAQSGWNILMSENFEGAFPSGLWGVFDNNGADYGEYYWDDDDYLPHLGAWSAWPANGGANGVDPQYFYYPNNMDAWMMYGPFDLSSCSSADFEFYYNNDSESGHDYFGWGGSPNGSNLYGLQISGDSGGWQYVDFSLNSYLGDTSVWLAFIFRSDSSVVSDGPFVDDITLWCYQTTTVSNWTFMVYMDGDNNLESAAINDFLEMSSVGSTTNVKIVTQMDRIAGYSTAYDDWTDTRRFDITPGLTPSAASGVSIGEANMGDPETLLNFVRWAKARAPANHYVLVFWDHGSGWKAVDADELPMKGVAFDDTSGGDSISSSELRSALANLTSNGSYPFDIVGMDACLMAMIEVDDQIKPYAYYRVGSEEPVPNDGWPYDTILSTLVANPSMAASTLAIDIVDFYNASYPSDPNQTHSAVNLGTPYTTLNTAVNTLASALYIYGGDWIDEIQMARNNTTEFYDPDFIDLWDFADWVRIYVSEPNINNAAIAVENAVLAAVIREHHGSNFLWARGISIYFPKTTYDTRYDGSSGFLWFTGNTNWDEWIHLYQYYPNWPAMFNKSYPTYGAGNVPIVTTLSWAASTRATAYYYCIDTINDSACNTSWTYAGEDTNAVVSLNEATTYYWQVAALNTHGTVYANHGSWYYFTTGSLPAAFNKSAPANGATNQSLSPTLTWGASSGATSYEYCYDTTNDNACSGWTSNGTSTSKILSGLSQYTTYYWHVRALNSIGTRYSNGSITAFWSFTTGGVPGAFGKTSPTNGATNQSLNPTLSWGTSSNATSYEYCYDTTNDNNCYDIVNNGSSTSISLSGLTPGTTYYWNVRAVNSFGITYSDGPATAFWLFTTGFPPTAFNKSSPANGATNQPLNPTLSWASSTGVASYEYCYDTTNDDTCSGWTNNGSATSVGLSGLSASTTYYWHVRAVNSFGTTYANGSSTAFYSFATGNPPGAFSKSSPANGATNQPLNPTLSWGSSTGVTSYEYCYDTSNDNACSGWTNNGTATSVGLSSLSTGTTYYWHVRANNSFGTTYANGSSTAFYSFATGNPPGAFNKSGPANGATNQPLNPTLSWVSSTGVTSYEYCYDTSDDNACSGWTNNGTATSVGLSSLATGTTYYWQVRAINSFGTTYANGSSTAFYSFTTGSPPSAFNKSNPPNGADTQPLNPTLSWGSSSGVTNYEYCYDTSDDNACSGWTNNGTATSVGLSGLSPSTIYYWHVRANNSFGTTYANGAVTAFWSFTTGGPPGIFNKASPSNGATNQSLNPTLTWASSVGVSSYEYCYDTSNDNDCSGWTNNGTATSVSLSGLSTSTTYYWHVRAINSFGTTYANASTTAFWSFTTGSLPGAFSKSLPANGATNRPANLTLSWAVSSGATGYEYCYDTSNDNTCSGWTNNGTSTSVALSGLNPSTTYYWHVRSVNSIGTTHSNGSSSAFWSFATGDPPGSFSKTLPANGAVDQFVSLSLSWGASSAATSYEYCYDTTDDGICSGWTAVGASTSVVLSGLSAETTYYWHVRAINSFATEYSNGSSTAFWHFTTVNVYFGYLPVARK
jgi:hypothetical protein